ncbi:radical SAM family heme chaperone HemW [Odoribacter lunatus]|uniref:radical SAM family heme chaperone HemW n=1 Tax=Odoribacter lunatus TaxID=2941335 RepID=UPI00203F93E0|nr:radical SAM family heme chaperone HemW [Odoribacter lunatus]
MGIYVHVPFCRSKCFYCGFYSVASDRLKEAFIRALCAEVDLRRDYMGTLGVETLYFGGGTPSCLSLSELQILTEKLENVYCISPFAERTIEVNPEDLNAEKLEGWRRLGFNRLSIGVQSFQDDLLKGINRQHTSRQVLEGIEMAQHLGFDNISIDLIIGLPGQSPEILHQDLMQALGLSVDHISVYMLSVDAGSVLEKRYQKGLFCPLSEDELADRYDVVVQLLKEAGYEHYEISNFARNGKYSTHNTSYWQQKPYIGFGPSAHSYDLASRQWNVSNLKTYIESLNNKELNFEREELSCVDYYNEYVMTRLRTMWGIKGKDLREKFGFCWDHFIGQMRRNVERGWAVEGRDLFCLTESGWLVSDKIFSELFL